MRSRYPGILLNIVEGMSGHLSHMIRLGQLDIAILFNSDVSTDLTAATLLDEELFVLLPRSSTLVAESRNSLTIAEVAEVAELPLVLPTGTHGLRRRSIASEFEQRNLAIQVVAEIDSLSLLMNCVYDGMGATIKPLSALQLEGQRRHDWRALTVSDARMSRRNYVYSISPERLSPTAAVVITEVRDTAEDLVTSGEWHGVSLTPAPR